MTNADYEGGKVCPEPQAQQAGEVAPGSVPAGRGGQDQPIPERVGQTAKSLVASQSSAEYVIVHRDALFEFFGQMALPPWRDERGKLLGGGINCAPIAEQITKWVDDHDLSSLYDVAPTTAGSSPMASAAAAHNPADDAQGAQI